MGADIREVARGMGYDPRIGPSYLEAGLGFGGPCLEKDLKALIKIAESNHYPMGVLKVVLERNERQIQEILAVFGLAFKASTPTPAALLILTDWPQYRELDYHQIKERMAAPRVVDGRNLLDGRTLQRLGFVYVSMGRT